MKGFVDNMVASGSDGDSDGNEEGWVHQQAPPSPLFIKIQDSTGREFISFLERLVRGWGEEGRAGGGLATPA